MSMTNIRTRSFGFQEQTDPNDYYCRERYLPESEQDRIREHNAEQYIRATYGIEGDVAAAKLALAFYLADSYGINQLKSDWKAQIADAKAQAEKARAREHEQEKLREPRPDGPIIGCNGVIDAKLFKKAIEREDPFADGPATRQKRQSKADQDDNEADVDESEPRARQRPPPTTAQARTTLLGNKEIQLVRQWRSEGISWRVIEVKLAERNIKITEAGIRKAMKRD
jgi:hypothetical protein